MTMAIGATDEVRAVGLNKDILLALAKRCEREPASRPLDADLCDAVGIKYGDFREYGRRFEMSLPYLTSRLDAAMETAVDGASWTISRGRRKPGDFVFNVTLWADDRRQVVLGIGGSNFEPAMAFLAAATRALAATS